MKNISINYTLNGRPRTREVPSHQVLIDLIRKEERLLGTKVSCDQSVCGTCTVLINNEPRAACATFSFEIDNCNVLTIEGLAVGNKMSAIQQAFLNNSAIQCGYCTPGMVMSAIGIIDDNPNPSEIEIREALEGNICRCTGYHNIVLAISAAAKVMRA